MEKNTVVGSKRFTESYVLGELLNLTLRDAGVPAIHRQGLGNTAIVVQALMTGQIDVYPEYTGTILREILKRPETQVSLDELNALLKPKGLKVAIPLGFNNTYALAMRPEQAKALGLKRISDIANLSTEQQSTLRIALSPEFKIRADGWPALKQAYDLKVKAGKVLEHGLAYDALVRGDVDIVDAYSTDATICLLYTSPSPRD
jgi:osmoprotectant transport system permease protein